MKAVGRKETMTVEELQLFLLSYPKDMPIMATWEGVQASIRPGNFEVVEVQGMKVLEVDVEDYFS